MTCHIRCRKPYQHPALNTLPLLLVKSKSEMKSTIAFFSFVIIGIWPIAEDSNHRFMPSSESARNDIGLTSDDDTMNEPSPITESQM